MAIGAAMLLAATASGLASAAVSVTPIETLERGMHATVKGTVVQITDEDTFKLKDDTGDISVYIGWRNRVAVEPGEVVTVEGVVDDDLLSVIWPEFYANRITREDGSVIELR
jgi:uncharacterized protein YdeI (BOF family)